MQLRNMWPSERMVPPMKLFVWYYPRIGEMGEASYVDAVLGKLRLMRAAGVYFMVNEAAVTSDGEAVRALFARLVEAGLEVQLGFLPFSEPPNPTPEMLRRRYSYYEDRTLKFGGLCPAWPENRLLAIQRAAQLCEFLQPTALHLDYIRYSFANDQSFGYDLEWEEGGKWLGTYHNCECPLCQTERLELLGREPNGWDRRHPGYVFKRLGQRAEHVEEVVRGLRRLCEQRQMKLSAAVRVQYFNRALIEGQDWVRWCKLGLVDSISPMNYDVSVEVVERRFRENQRLLAEVPVEVLEGLARKSSAGEINGEQLAEQVRRVVELGADGAAVFHLDALTNENCELLGEL